MHAVIQRIAVVAQQFVEGRGAASQGLHGLAGVAERLFALVVEQTIGVAHQRRGLFQRGAGLFADGRQLLHGLANIAALLGNDPSGLLQMLKRLAQALDVVRGKHLIGVVQQQVDAGHQVIAVVEQAGDGRGCGDDHRRFTVVPCQRRALGRAATELDNRGAGDAGQCQLGLGVLLDRCFPAQAHLCQHPARVVRVQAQIDDVADLDPAVLHRAAPGQPADRLVEHHFVILEFTVHVGLGQPQAKQQGAGHHNDGEQADQHMMGSGFHVKPRWMM